MPDYYIKTPDREESRGPFDIEKLQTLADAGQVTEETLYYDDAKEAWQPIADNETLKDGIFPEKEKLTLKVRTEGESSEAQDRENKESDETDLKVEEMLAAAEGTTEDTRHRKKEEESFQKAVALASSGIGLMLLFSAITLIVPHFEAVTAAIEEEAYGTVINYPFLMIGLFDFLMAVMLFLAVTEIYPLLRVRAMLTLGFGAYVGWALGDPILVAASVAGGIGILLATLAQAYGTMLLALLLGLGGNGYLAYLSLSERFANFFDAVRFNLIPSG